MSAIALLVDHKSQPRRAREIAESLNVHAMIIRRGLSASGRVYLNIITGAMNQIADGRAGSLGLSINETILALIPEIEKLNSYSILGIPTDASQNPAHKEMKRTLAKLKPELLMLLEEIPLTFIAYEAA